MDKILHQRFSPWVTKHRFVFMGLFLCWTVGNCWSAVNVRPATAADQFLPEDHPFQRITTIQSSKFDTSTQDGLNRVFLIWGVKTVDRTGVNMLYDSTYIGKPVFDEDFKLDLVGQAHILSVCRDLANQDFVARDRSETTRNDYSCFLEEFRDWAVEKGYGFPILDIESKLPEFLSTSTLTDEGVMTFERKYGDRIGMVNGTLKYFALSYESRMNARSFYSRTELESFYNNVENYVASVNARAPSSVNKMFQTDKRRFWIRMRSQQVYVSSAISGALAGTALAFMVILFATRCIRVAIFATISIGGILLSVLAFMVSIGWELGTIEAINITVLAGFSVDYVVHLAHAYMASKSSTSIERVHDATKEIGISVFSGMITSVGASLLLFFCQLQFFAKFGGFLCSTIGFSWIWANMFFMSLLAAFGPGSKPDNAKLYF